MFGVGWTEMLLIGVVALVVIGPKDLPVVMNRLGKMVATIRRMGNEFQHEFNKATDLGLTEPTGVIAPKDPAAESIVAEINEKAGMTPVAQNEPLKPVMTELAPLPASGPVESPAPVEA